jgi:ligand-binding sensor protein
MNNSDNYIRNFLEAEFFQILQDRLAEEFQVASIITDIHGFPITKPSNFTDFCMKYTRGSEIGSKKCMACDAYGGIKAKSLKKPVVYKCHAELIDFASPILMGDKLIGCFLCGQILCEKPDKEKYVKLAEEFGIDPDTYITALENVKILPYEEIEYIANFVYKISSKISDFTYYQDVGIESSKNFKKSTEEFNAFLEKIENKNSAVNSTFRNKVKDFFLRIHDTLFKKIEIDENNITIINECVGSISKETSEINRKLRETKENFESSTTSLFPNSN